MSMNDTETFLTEIRYPESFQEVVESLRLAMLAMKKHRDNAYKSKNLTYEDIGRIRITIMDKSEPAGKHGIQVSFKTDILETL